MLVTDSDNTDFEALLKSEDELIVRCCTKDKIIL